MARRIPSYRQYKPKNLGLVVIDGKYHYLGKYGTPESVAEYNRLVQEWLVRQQTLPDADGKAPPLTIDALILAFWKHAHEHYRHTEGRPTRELDNLRDALRLADEVAAGPLLAVFRQPVLDDLVDLLGLLGVLEVRGGEPLVEVGQLLAVGRFAVEELDVIGGEEFGPFEGGGDAAVLVRQRPLPAHEVEAEFLPPLQQVGAWSLMVLSQSSALPGRSWEPKMPLAYQPRAWFGPEGPQDWQTIYCPHWVTL